MATGGDISIRKQLDDITECSICSERFLNPRSLPCIHSFCLKCIERFTSDKQPGMKMPCPMCQKEFTIPDGGVSELPKNFFVVKLMQIKLSASESAPSLCDSCQLDEARGLVEKNATTYCVDCHEKYCEECTSFHKTFKVSKSHKLVKLNECGELCHQEEVICKSSPTLCEKHPDQALSVYCRDCKSAICVICYIASHKQHDCADINDVTEQFRNLMTTDVSSLADVAGKLRGLLTSVEEQKLNFTKTVGETAMEINKEAETKQQLIERNRQTLLDELATRQQHVVKRFDNLSHEITQHLSLVDNLKKYTEELSRKGAGADIARETSVVHERVEELSRLDVIEQSRDDMDATDVQFTASTIVSEACDNAIGKIEVTISAKVAMPTVPTLTNVIPNTCNRNVVGVTSLNNQLYVVHSSAQQQIEVYDTATFTLQRNISVPCLGASRGLASCAVNNCLYVTECGSNLVYRVALHSSGGTVTQWSVGKYPWGISVNSASNVLVTCHNEQKLQEYSTQGLLIRDISLSSVGVIPCCSIQLPSGKIAISYEHGVLVVDNNGAVIRNITNTSGASIQFKRPRGCASVQNGCTLLVNRDAHQVLLFNPSFSSTRVLSLPSNSALQDPWALFFDESRGRLYVGEYDGCRVLVFDNVFNVGSDFQ